MPHMIYNKIIMLISQQEIYMKITKIKDLSFNDGKPKICVPLMGPTEQDFLSDINYLNNMDVDFDFVEIRADYFSLIYNTEEVIGLLKKIRESYTKTLLFTFRTKKEGGMYDMSEENYFALNHSVIESKLVDIIDIELFSSGDKIKEIVAYAHSNNVKIIMSNHEFSNTPPKEEIIKRLVKMQDYNADITKIVVMPNCEKDVLTLMEATLEMKTTIADRPFITTSMGSLGVITRLTGELFGSCVTFAALNKVSAPGQVDVRYAREILNKLSI